MRKTRERSKSLGHILHQVPELKQETKTKESTDIRSVCRKVSPYVVRQWREVCDELGVPDDKLDAVQADYGSGKMSELAYQGLCIWMDMVGRLASNDKLLKAVRACGLRRAEDEIKSIQDKKQVPCFAKPPVTEPQTKDRHTKQKAMADRLSRPKSRASEPSEPTQPTSQQQKRRPSFISENTHPLLLKPSTTRHSELCEVKVKVTVNGVKRKGAQEVESTRDDFASTKDDFKHICHTFVKLVMFNQQTHFKQLKHKLGFKDIAVIGLNKVGFNIQLLLVCFKLGALETLLQAYETKRLKKILHSCLVPQTYMDKLGIDGLDVSISIDEGQINRNRQVLIDRNSKPELPDHPMDEVEVCSYLLDDDLTVHDDTSQSMQETIKSFELQSWHEQLNEEIRTINERLRKFLRTVTDFLLILRILKPAEKANINCLHDVIECFHHIKNSKHLNNGTHNAVVEEYLSIVNQIRLKVLYIHEFEGLIMFDDSMNDDTNELFHNHLYDIDVMLEPDFEFEVVINEMEIEEPGLTLQTLIQEIESTDGNKLILSTIERTVYGGCLCFLPALVGKLVKLSDALDKPSHNVQYDIGREETISVMHNENRTEQAVA